MPPVNPLLDDSLRIGVSLPDLALAASAVGNKGTPSFSPDIIAIAQRAGVNDPTAAFAESVTDCNALLADITKRLKDAANACIVQCADGIDQCCACLRARADVTAESVKAVLDKCHGKIEKSITQAYSATVGSLMQMGCDFPTAEQIQAVTAGVSPELAISQTLPNVVQIVAADVKPIPAPEGQVGSGVTDQPKPVLPAPIQNRICPSHDENGNPLTYPCPVGYWGELDEFGCFYCRPGPSVHAGVLYPNGSGGFSTSPVGGQKPAPLGANIPSPEGTPAPANCSISANGNIICPGPTLTLDDTQPPAPSPKPGPASPPSPLPPPGPPTLVDGVCCYPPSPTQMIGCRTLPPPPPPPVMYWATCDMDCCGARTVCIYAGYSPPVVASGTALYGPAPTADAAVACIPQPVTTCGTQGSAAQYCGTWPGGSGTTGGTGGGTGGTGTTGGTGGGTPLPLGGGSPGLPPTPSPEPSPEPSPVPSPGDGGSGGGTLGTPPGSDTSLAQWQYCTIAKLGNAFANLESDLQSANPTSQAIGTHYQDAWQADCSDWATGTGWICTIGNKIGAFLGKFFDRMVNDVGCNNTYFVQAMGGNVILGFMRHWLGVIPQAITARNQYNQNLACQYNLPSTPEYNRLYIQGMLTDREWKAGVAANGDCIEPQTVVRDSQYRYPTVQESAILYRRGYISSDAFYKLSRLNSVRSADFADLQFRLSEYVPTDVETIVWTQQQTADPFVVQSLQLDDGFDQWWNSGGQQDAASHGVSDNTARQHWRNGWQLPSLQFATAAYRRLISPFPIPGTDRVAQPVTPHELSALADYQRMPGGWAERAIALSYTPVSIRYLTKLLITGVIDEQGFSARLQSIGYTPDDADLIARSNTIASRPQIAKLNGLPTQAEVLRLYSSDAISETDAVGMLSDIGIDAVAAIRMVQTADTIRDARWREKQLNVIRRRYLFGDFSGQQLTTELLGIGIAVEKVTRITDSWFDELRLKKKEPAVAMLCEWFTRGYIDATTYVERLIRLGYSRDDAVRIQASCGQKYTDAQNKQLAASLARAERIAKAEAKANRPCRPRPKQLCGVGTKRTHTVVHDDTGKHGPKTTDTTTTQVDEQQGDTTILEKVEEKHLTPG